MKPNFTDTKKYPYPYRGACDTNISETFERVRRLQKLSEALLKQKVAPIKAYIQAVAA
jgi:hypothetical protein